MRRMLVAGNWKMNGLRDAIATLCTQVSRIDTTMVDVLVCPPYPYLQQVRDQCDARIGVGAQNVSLRAAMGAYTGEVHAAMLRDLNCEWVIVGHSEQRQYHGDSNPSVAQRFACALEYGLHPILCVGETLAQREAQLAEAVIAEQLEAVIEHVGIKGFETAVIAYEPVWAIGTGKTAEPHHAQAIHQFIRSHLAEYDVTIARSVRIVYGGSVKPKNARDLFAQPDIDGGLVGGAALIASDFMDICAAAHDAKQP